MYKYKPSDYIPQPGDVVEFTKDMHGRFCDSTEHIGKLAIITSVKSDTIVTVHYKPWKSEDNRIHTDYLRVLDTLPGTMAAVGDQAIFTVKPMCNNDNHPTKGNVYTVHKITHNEHDSYIYWKSTDSICGQTANKFVVLQKAEPEFKYPIYKKHKHSSLVLRFEDYEFASCVVEGDGWYVGDQDNCDNHEESAIWEDWNLQFDYDTIMQPNTAVACPTESEANELLYWFEQNGFNYFKYNSGFTYKPNYCLGHSQYSDLAWYRSQSHYTILTMDEARNGRQFKPVATYTETNLPGEIGTAKEQPMKDLTTPFDEEITEIQSKENTMKQPQTMDMLHLRNTVGQIRGASTYRKVECVRELWKRGDKYATFGPGYYRNEPHLPSFLTYSYRLFFPDYVYSDVNGQYSDKAGQVKDTLYHIQNTYSSEDLNVAFSMLQEAMIYQYTRDGVLTYDDVIVLFGIPTVNDFSTPFDEPIEQLATSLQAIATAAELHELKQPMEKEQMVKVGDKVISTCDTRYGPKGLIETITKVEGSTVHISNTSNSYWVLGKTWELYTGAAEVSNTPNQQVSNFCAENAEATCPHYQALGNCKDTRGVGYCGAYIGEQQTTKKENTMTIENQQLAEAIATGIAAANCKSTKCKPVKTDFELRKPITATFFNKKKFGGNYLEIAYFDKVSQADDHLQSMDNPNRIKMVVHHESEIVNVSLPVHRKKSK